jgi:hypothetical protein
LGKPALPVWTIKKCTWNYSLTRPRLSHEKVIDYIKIKKEFTRLDLEKEFNLSKGRAYWHVKNLLNKEIIVNTDRTLNLLEKGKVYAVYKLLMLKLS